MSPDHFIQMLETSSPHITAAQDFAVQMHTADIQWDEVMSAVKNYRPGRSVMSGTALFVLLSRFFHELIPDDEQLCARLVQHFERRLCADFPPAQGKLL